MTYDLSFFLSFFISLILTPLFRLVAIKLSILDHPSSEIKTHKVSTPYLGGLAISISFFITLFLIRLTTNFPTGTLRSLRGIFYGSLVIIILGLIDDFVYNGLHFTTKFVGQIIAAIILIIYNIKINFISPEWFANVLTILWIVGITNSINLIDVMDGLSAGVVFISSIGFFILSYFLKGEVYIGYAALAIMGACLGFLPYNLSNKYKIFMGDTGSLFLGFVLAALTLGSGYSYMNSLGVLAPVVLLLIPIYETIFISFVRLRKGISPFVGSKDHFSLRLMLIGMNKTKILLLSYMFGIILLLISLIIVFSATIYLPIIALIILSILITVVTRYLVKIEI
ncbi:MAG: undecaprenyl/decaprenyl-phosphate alpha-N-acetylglucosaminyl 1-phosphate transferase [Endomicrobia bacterium]|nr:undecaprenyl/decaprenyl-phosphate alpha-N-acetylglucosaminyl 1-phosphate transferase [Endomicrobiia bacterium]